MFLFLAGALSGALTVIAAAGIALAAFVRRYGKSFDRENIALAEANAAFHGSKLYPVSGAE